MYVKFRFSWPMAKERDPILQAIIKAHGLAAIAEACGGITIQAVSDWTRVPPRQCLAVEALSGVPREKIRPDIYGAPRPRPRMKVRAAVAA